MSEAVKLVTERGVAIVQACRDLELSAQTHLGTSDAVEGNRTDVVAHIGEGEFPGAS